MSDDAPPRKRRRLWKWVRRGGLVVLLLVTLLLAAGWYYTRPARLKAVLETALASATGADTHLEFAKLDDDWRLIVRGLTLRVPDERGGEGPYGRLFRADWIVVNFDWSRLLRLDPALDAVTIDGWTAFVTEDIDEGRFNYELLKPSEEEGDGPFALPRVLPQVFLRDGNLRYARREGGELLEEGNRGLTGQLVADTQHPHRYLVELRETPLPGDPPSPGDGHGRETSGGGASGGGGADAAGWIDLEAVEAELTLKQFSLDRPQRGLLPAMLREWWDRLDPQGELPTLSVHVKRDDEGQVKLASAELRVSGVSLTPPITTLLGENEQAEDAKRRLRLLQTDELAQAAKDAEDNDGDDRPGVPVPQTPLPRLTDVTGGFVYRDGTVHIEGLTGRFEEVRFRVGGFYTLGEGEPFRIEATTRPFEVSTDSRLAGGLGWRIRRGFSRFDPAGTVRGAVVIERDEAGQPPQIEAELRLLDAAATFHKFPVRVRGLRGTVRMDNERVVMEGIEGRGPGEMRVRVEGTVTPPGDGAAVELRIEATDVPLDERVFEAMKPKHQEPLLLFMNPVQYARLAARGLIARPAGFDEFALLPAMRDRLPAQTNVPPGVAVDVMPDPPAGYDPPTFALGGTAKRVIVEISRPFGPDGEVEMNNTVSIDVDGLSGLFKFWPYPLTATGGRVVIREQVIEVNDVGLRSPTGGVGTISGTIVKPQHDDEDAQPHLTIRDGRLPVDPLLLASIPQPQDQFVRDLNLTGTFSLTGAVYPKSATHVGWRVEASFKDATATPFGGQVTFRDLTGGFVLSDEQLSLAPIVGLWNGTTYHADGGVDWSAGEPELAFTFTADDLRYDPRLLDLIPPDTAVRQQLLDLHATYQPDAVVSGEYRWQQTGIGGEQHRLTLHLKAAAFTYSDHRVRLADVEGVIDVTAECIRLDALRGTFGGGDEATGRVTLDGELALPGGDRWTLELQAEAPGVTSTLRAFMPDGAEAAVDAVAFDGPFTMRGRLRTWPLDPPKLAEVNDRDEMSLGSEFDALIRLQDATANVGLAITGLDGRLRVRTLVDHADRPALVDLKLLADRLRATDRRIAPLRLHLSNTEKARERLAIRQLHGQVYGGVLTGEGVILLPPLDAAEDEVSTYQLRLSLADVALNPFIEPATPPAAASASAPTPSEAAAYPAFEEELPMRLAIPGAGAGGAEGSDADEGWTVLTQPPGERGEQQGVFSMQVGLEGPLGVPEERRGRGRFEVRDATLFERPLGMAILQAANLSLPSSTAFSHASAAFMIVGQTVAFDPLLFEAPGIAMMGAGTLELPDLELDLRMVTRNRGGIDVPLFSDLYNALKDELVTLRITGTLDEPSTSVTALSGVRGTVSDLFEGGGVPQTGRDTDRRGPRR